MELIIHSGFGQTEPNITVSEERRDALCVLTVYRFVDHEGMSLNVRLYEHMPLKRTPAKPTEEQT
jgi:hypothetical protein